MARASSVCNDSGPPPGLCSELWHSALDAEVASAARLLDINNLRDLFEHYEQLGLESEALGLASRLPRFGSDHHAFLPFMLESLIRQRDLKRLNQVTRVVQGLRNRSSELRRPLARALALLGQVKPAAQEWHAVLESDAMQASDWLHLAQFMSEHGDVKEFGVCLEEMTDKFKDHPAEPFVLFCVLRSQFDRDLLRAQKTLDRIPPDSINDALLSFGLAVLAFRIGDYDRAQAAARHALVLKPEWPVAANALLTFQSFAGNTANGMRVLPVPQLPAVAAQVTGLTIPPNQFAWGVILDLGEGKTEAVLAGFDAPGERGLELPESGSIWGTFSVLPETPRGNARESWPDPLEVLPYLDWSFPHIMVQRSPKHPELHGFVGASGHREWYWEEVLLMSAAKDSIAREENRRGALVWTGALEELERRDSEEAML